MGDYYTAMQSEAMPPLGLKQLDKLMRDQEALCGLKNPIKTTVHEEALALEDIKPGTVVQLHNKNL